MTWPPLRPSWGCQQPPTPHQILHRREQLRCFRYKSYPWVDETPSSLCQCAPNASGVLRPCPIRRGMLLRFLSEGRPCLMRLGPPMSALGQTQIFAVQKGMSALPPKADIGAAVISRLYRGARYRSVRAEHATITRFGFQPLAAALAVVKVLASISGHMFRRAVSAFWAGDCCNFDQWCSLGHGTTSMVT